MTQPTDDRSITRLIKALPNHAAIMELGEIGAPAAKAVPHLIRLLERENSRLDEFIVRTLGKIGDPRSVPILVKTVLENPDDEARWFAGLALGKIGRDEAANLLAQSLRENAFDSEPWRWALTALRNMGSPGAKAISQVIIQSKSVVEQKKLVYPLTRMNEDAGIPGLSHVLKHAEFDHSPSQDHSLWQDVIGALGKLKAVEAIPIIIDEFIKSGIACGWPYRALLEIGEPSITYLIPLLSHETLVARYAASLLGELSVKSGDRRAIPALITAFSDPRTATDSMADALRKIGDPTGAPVLLAALDNAAYRDSVQVSAAKALGCLGYAHVAKPHLLRFLVHNQELMRWTAVEGLALIGDQESLNAIKEAYNDPHRIVRRTVIEELGAKKHLSHVPLFIKALGDRDTMVMDRAKEALLLLGKSVLPHLRDALNSNDPMLRKELPHIIGEIESA